jgi:hypothetical protein
MRKIKFTKQKKTKFCRVLAENGGNRKLACDAVGISYMTYLRATQNDPQFVELLEIADKQAGDMLEAEAYRRAYTGIDEPVYQQGELVGFKKNYSDKLLLVLMKANNPGKYTEKSEVNYTGTIEHKVINEAKDSLLKSLGKIIDVTPEKKTLTNKKNAPIDLEATDYIEIEDHSDPS